MGQFRARFASTLLLKAKHSGLNTGLRRFTWRSTRRFARNGWGVALLALLLTMTGCGRQPAPTPTPMVTPIPVVGLSAGSAVRASGKIVPASAAELSFTVAGRVQAVVGTVGDQVSAGAPLITLADTSTRATVAQAQAARQRAQANLAELEAGPRPQEIAAGQAGLRAAQAHLLQLTEEPRPEDVAAAQANLAAAQARLDRLYAEPDASIIAGARADVQQAQAALERLLHPATASQIAGAEAQVQQAQAELDLLAAGPRTETVAAAAAAVAEAEANLQRSEADLAALQLHAPFTGTVTAIKVNPGEIAQPGQVVLTLADLNRLQVETTDLSERDVVQVAVGQPVTVFVKPLNEELTGRVARIAPQATVIGGDVVYTVVVELDDQAAEQNGVSTNALRWGMSVDVEIATLEDE
jgi:multidrug efflux pump subunit AcrA (membrane-fusion protein)